MASEELKLRRKWNSLHIEPDCDSPPVSGPSFQPHRDMECGCPNDHPSKVVYAPLENPSLSRCVTKLDVLCLGRSGVPPGHFGSVRIGHEGFTVGKPFPPDLKLKTLTIHIAIFWKIGRHWREQMHSPGYCNTARMAVLRAPPRELHEVVPKSLCQLTLEGEILSTEASTLQWDIGDYKADKHPQLNEIRLLEVCMDYKSAERDMEFMRRGV